MRVLITGAGGFVGTYLADHLSRAHEVISTARHPIDDKQILLDLLDDKSIETFAETHHDIDAIVHVASRLASPDMTLDDQMMVFNENTAMALRLIRLAKMVKCYVLINFSSMAVYPNEDGVYDETSEIRMSCNSDCMYGLSKFVIENMIDMALKNTIRIVHLRLGQIYGKYMRQDRIIPIMVKSIKKDNKIEVYGNGERVSNFISVEKVCDAVEFVLKRREVQGIYNVGDENLSYLDLAERLKKKYGDSNTRIILIDRGSKVKFILNTDKWDRCWRNAQSV